jgi:hypothetical protein
MLCSKRNISIGRNPHWYTFLWAMLIQPHTLPVKEGWLTPGGELNHACQLPAISHLLGRLDQQLVSSPGQSCTRRHLRGAPPASIEGGMWGGVSAACYDRNATMVKFSTVL